VAHINTVEVLLEIQKLVNATMYCHSSCKTCHDSQAEIYNNNH